jgi:hypothetical protein
MNNLALYMGVQKYTIIDIGNFVIFILLATFVASGTINAEDSEI